MIKYEPCIHQQTSYYNENVNYIRGTRVPRAGVALSRHSALSITGKKQKEKHIGVKGTTFPEEKGGKPTPEGKGTRFLAETGGNSTPEREGTTLPAMPGANPTPKGEGTTFLAKTGVKPTSEGESSKIISVNPGGTVADVRECLNVGFMSI